MGRKGPGCEASDRSVSANDTLRSDNDADGPFPAHPKGDTLFARPRRHSSSLYRLDRGRRRSLMAGENRVVAGSLGFSEAPKSSIFARTAEKPAQVLAGQGLKRARG